VFKTVVAYDGDRALELVQQTNPIFVVLDLMLPKMDGWEVCRTIRRSSDVPILILTAREEEMDRVLGLSLGADDYLVKPFSPRELVARVKAILRRTRSESREQKNLLSFGRLVLDLQKRRVTLSNRPISLTRFEYNLLSTLMAAPGRIFSREELLTCLYSSGEAVIDRVIDVHIGKLRLKIEDDVSSPRYILTVRGLGYRFADDDDR